MLGPLDGLFSGGYRSVVERGINEIITGAMLDAEQYNVIKTRKWNLFGDSTKYETIFNELDGRVLASLSSVFENVGLVSIGLAEALGRDVVDKVNAYTIPELKIDLTGLNGEEASKKINAVFSTALDTMAETVFGDKVGLYQKLGEGMLETAARVVAEVAVVEDALSTSGLQMGKDTLAIADYLAEAAGGLKEFQGQFKDYFEAFYSDAEQQARLQAQLQSQLGNVFLALPDSREGYRDLVEALDMSNARDRERYSLLIKLAGAADEYYSALESGLDAYRSKIDDAWQTAQSLLENQVSTYRQFVEQFKDLSGSLLSGSLSTATPEQKYNNSKSEFDAIKRTLATGTDAEKEAAYGKLPGVVNAFLDASRGFNASGLAYTRDFVAAQALLADAIDKTGTQADVAQLQLDQLTEQLTALGLINSSVLTVKDAVDAVGMAIADFNDYQKSLAEAEFQNANKAAFNERESARRSAYDAPINATAAARAVSAGKSESRLPWAADTSKWAFTAEAMVDPSTGGIVRGEHYQGHSSEVVNTLKESGFKHVREQFAHIAGLVESIMGGDLPDVKLRIESNGRGDTGRTSYDFAGFARSIADDDPDALVRLYAKDAAGYLADALGNADWAGQVKKVSFASISSGINELSQLMAHLRNPYKPATYDPKKTYVDGPHRDGLEQVPFDGYVAELHKGERILTASESAAYNSIINNTANSAGDVLNHYDGNVLANHNSGSAIYHSPSTVNNAAFTRWYQQTVDGSHRDGLERVPFDGYVAELHKGERVLTARETATYEGGALAMARPAWLDELVSVSRQTYQATADDKKLVEELKKNNDELKKQTRVLTDTVNVLQVGFSKLVNAEQGQTQTLAELGSGLRIAELNR